VIYNWKKIVRYGLPLLTFSILIEIFAGQLLQLWQDKLMMFPIFLISIPVINGVGGNIGSVLGARLASGLHVGYISLDVKDKKMHENLLTSILIGIVTYEVLAILIYFTASFGGTPTEHWIDLIEFVSIVLGAGILLVFVISLVSVFTAFWSFKKGFDPDDTVAPVVTTVGDTLGIVFLFLLIGVVGI
jgi:mgtE-like transporter